MSATTRQLGSSSHQVNTISFGLMSLGHAFGHAGDTPTRLKVLDGIYDLGLRTWDGADRYGDTEDLVGEWLSIDPSRRRNVFLTTKCGITPERTVRSDPEYIMAACERSLSRMKTDYIDLYYIHRVDQKTPIEKTMEALSKLKKQGKIRHIGLSEVSAKTLLRASNIDKVDALQTEYSPFCLDVEQVEPGAPVSILDTCKELDVTIFAYAPLGKGFLTGAIKTPADFGGEMTRMTPRFANEAFERNMELVKAVGVVTEGVQKRQPEATQARVVLAWILRQWDGIIPLFGTKSVARAEENIGAVRITLTDEEDIAVRRAAESLKQIGDRYPGAFMGMINADTPEL